MCSLRANSSLITVTAPKKCRKIVFSHDNTQHQQPCTALMSSRGWRKQQEFEQERKKTEGRRGDEEDSEKQGSSAVSSLSRLSQKSESAQGDHRAFHHVPTISSRMGPGGWVCGGGGGVPPAPLSVFQWITQLLSHHWAPAVRPRPTQAAEGSIVCQCDDMLSVAGWLTAPCALFTWCWHVRFCNDDTCSLLLGHELDIWASLLWNIYMWAVDVVDADAVSDSTCGRGRLHNSIQTLTPLSTLTSSYQFCNQWSSRMFCTSASDRTFIKHCIILFQLSSEHFIFLLIFGPGEKCFWSSLLSLHILNVSCSNQHRWSCWMAYSAASLELLHVG